MKIAFDFDGTLTNEKIQNICRKFIEENQEVWIVTTRWDKYNEHMYLSRFTQDKIDNARNNLLDIANKLGIKNIFFTNMKPKAEFINSNNFDVLYDNDIKESIGLNCQFVDANKLIN